MEATVSYLLQHNNITSIQSKKKKKKSEIEDYALCLGNISKDFTIYNMKKKNRIKRSCKFFSVALNPIDTNDILDIHKYLMKRT